MVGGEVVEVGGDAVGDGEHDPQLAQRRLAAVRRRREEVVATIARWNAASAATRRGCRRPWRPRSCSGRRPAARRRRRDDAGPSPPGPRVRASAGSRRDRGRPRPTAGRPPGRGAASGRAALRARAGPERTARRHVRRPAEPGPRRRRPCSRRVAAAQDFVAQGLRDVVGGLEASQRKEGHEPLQDPVSLCADTAPYRAGPRTDPGNGTATAQEGPRTPPLPVRRRAPCGQRDTTQARCSEDRAELSSNTVSTAERPNGP